VDYKLQFRHYDGTEHVRQLVETSVARLDRLAARFRHDAVSLRVVLEKNDVRTLFRVSLTLTVPGRTLATDEERHDETEAAREAFAEMQRQLERYVDGVAERRGDGGLGLSDGARE
jgi:ribosomal subunit interface protein